MTVTDETCIAKIYAGRTGSMPKWKLLGFNRWRGSLAMLAAIRRTSSHALPNSRVNESIVTLIFFDAYYPQSFSET